jgi:hypothetical protein
MQSLSENSKSIDVYCNVSAKSRYHVAIFDTPLDTEVGL